MKTKAKRKPGNPNVKKSIIAGGLVGTGGFLIAKAIGLIYSIPFSSILGSDAYMNFYGSAYRIYSYILNVFTAGMPMAVATMVAKYVTRKNYKTVLATERLALVLMGCLGFLGMLVMMALSSLIAPFIAEGVEGGASIMTWVLCLLAIAIFFVPILSAYRGFIQGCKEMEEYAYSQAFEQVFRIGFLLSVACLLVYGFHMATVWALYAAVLSTSVAAIAGIVQIRRYSSIQESSMAKLGRRQTERMVPFKPLLQEFLQLAIPYFLFAILAYSSDIYDAVLLPLGLSHSSYAPDQIQTMNSAVNYVGTKLTAIPMILSPGFVAAIIPHITSALEEKDRRMVRRDIRECLNIVMFLALFLSFCIFLYAKPLYYTLYYTADLGLASATVRWIAIDGFFSTITPVITSLLMALRMRKFCLRQLLVAAVAKGILMVPLVMWLGVGGAVLSTVCAYSYIIVTSLYQMQRRFGVSFKPLLSVLARTLICMAIMGVVAFVLTKAGLGSDQVSRIRCFLLMCVNGLISVAVFFGASLALHLPQDVFHLKLKKHPFDKKGGAAHV